MELHWQTLVGHSEVSVKCTLTFLHCRYYRENKFEHFRLTPFVCGYNSRFHVWQTGDSQTVTVTKVLCRYTVTKVSAFSVLKHGEPRGTSPIA